MSQVPEIEVVDRIREIADQVGASRRADGYVPRTIPRQSMEHSEPVRDTAAILAQRGTTHGDFTDNAAIMQEIKRSLWARPGWERLSDVQREALEMIVHKIGRIISGNPNVHDHWDDIAGYARLASERLVETK